jgi:DNA-directed DNA polymerase III PolC
MWELLEKNNNKNPKYFQEVTPKTPTFSLLKKHKLHSNESAMFIAGVDNYYVNKEDYKTYQPFADDKLLERGTKPLHIMDFAEWSSLFKNDIRLTKRINSSLSNLFKLSKILNADLKMASMVKYEDNFNIDRICRFRASSLGINLKSGVYADRFKREIKLIKEKDYSDYFMVVADLVNYAKTKMVVGPARGSSAGSLVCYLLGITEVDPIKYDLYFERFIDVNRFDLPDIDIDFQDDKRDLAIKYLEKKYGRENVAQIANINTLKPKSALKRFAGAIGIPAEELDELKESLIERMPGDDRFNKCIEDTFETIEVGKKFIEENPQIEFVKFLENHPSHMGVHAAGVLVCNDPITKYCGVNSRDENRIAMVDKKDAENIGLLKIDALALRTLTIFASVCDQLRKPYSWLYSIPLDDEKTYKIFSDSRFSGIFQFEGDTIQRLANESIIEDIEDISALTSIGRPGPLQAGSAREYVKHRALGEPNYTINNKIFKKATKITYGMLIYQEQVMKIVKEIGLLSWSDTSLVRQAISKSMGDSVFKKMFSKFKKGAKKNGLTNAEIEKLWDHINTMGGYAFNKSHSISYSVISFICAYFKAHFPLEFLVACLRNTKDDRSSLKILRDAVETDGIKYKFFCREKSDIGWSVIDGIIYGGFSSIKGIGEAKAKIAIRNRRFSTPNTSGLEDAIALADSPFKFLYPAKQVYGGFYSKTKCKQYGMSMPALRISKIPKEGTFNIIGCLISKYVKDDNNAAAVRRRNGVLIQGQTLSLNMKIEDDTGMILCKIKRGDYNMLGRQIAESGKEDKDWYLINCERVGGWDIVFGYFGWCRSRVGWCNRYMPSEMDQGF